MACYAMACRRRYPCGSPELCEHTWHACAPPADDTTLYRWVCGDCRASWAHHAEDHRWYRDPPEVTIQFEGR